MIFVFKKSITIIFTSEEGSRKIYKLIILVIHLYYDITCLIIPMTVGIPRRKNMIV